MPRLLSTLAGIGYAGRAAVRSYRDIDEIRRAGEREKREQETHAQRKHEWERDNPVRDLKAEEEAIGIRDTRTARQAAAGAYKEAPPTTPANSELSTPAAEAVTVRPAEFVPEPEARPLPLSAASPMGESTGFEDMPSGAPAPKPRLLGQVAMGAHGPVPLRSTGAEFGPPSGGPAGRGLDETVGEAGGSSSRPLLLSAIGARAELKPRLLGDLVGPSSGTPASSVNLAPGETGGTPDAARPKLTLTPEYRAAAATARARWKQGRVAEAQKIMKDFHENAVAELEAEHKFKNLPQALALRERKMTTEELQNDTEYQRLQLETQQNRELVIGHMWGMVKSGDMNGAVHLFNKSGLVLPGLEADHFQEVPDDKGVMYAVAVDKNGKVVQMKDGRPAAIPITALDRALRKATTKEIIVPERSQIVQMTRDESGNVTAKVLLPAVDRLGLNKRQKTALIENMEFLVQSGVAKDTKDAFEKLKTQSGKSEEAAVLSLAQTLMRDPRYRGTEGQKRATNEARSIVRSLRGEQPDTSTGGGGQVYRRGNDTFTDADVAATARKYGVTPEEVKRRLGVQ